MAFTRAMGGAAPKDNLRVVGINPGPVMTERLITLTKTRAEQRFGDADRWEELMKHHAFGRAAKPEEIAGDGRFRRLRPGLRLHHRVDHHDRRRRVEPQVTDVGCGCSFA